MIIRFISLTIIRRDSAVTVMYQYQTVSLVLVLMNLCVLLLSIMVTLENNVNWRVAAKDYWLSPAVQISHRFVSTAVRRTWSKLRNGKAYIWSNTQTLYDLGRWKSSGNDWIIFNFDWTHSTVFNFKCFLIMNSIFFNFCFCIAYTNIILKNVI